MRPFTGDPVTGWTEMKPLVSASKLNLFTLYYYFLEEKENVGFGK